MFIPLIFKTPNTVWIQSDIYNLYRTKYKDALEFWTKIKDNFTASGHTKTIPNTIDRLEQNIMKRIAINENLTTESSLRARYLQMTAAESFEYISFSTDGPLILQVLNNSTMLTCPSDVDLRRYASIAEAKDVCNSTLNTTSEIHQLFGTTIDNYIRYEDAIIALSDINNFNIGEQVKRTLRKGYIYLVIALLVLGFIVYHPLYEKYLQHSVMGFTIAVFVILVFLVIITYYGSFQ
jgi:hypothetical protein